MQEAQLTLFFGKMISPYLLITGIGFLVSKKFYLNMLNEANLEHPISINLSGMVHFFIGMAIMLTHFTWNNHLETVISLLGISFALKGFVLIVIPDLVIKSNQHTAKKIPLISAGFISIGLYLGWFCYAISSAGSPL